MKNKLPIIITNEAKSDVKGIVAYISLDNKLAGLNFAKLVKKTFMLLTHKDATYLGGIFLL